MSNHSPHSLIPIQSLPNLWHDSFYSKGCFGIREQGGGNGTSGNCGLWGSGGGDRLRIERDR
ncbi:MAG: hypothetical protein AB4042_01540 [Leptolyngbyaceae cyanobacterium]